MDKIDKNRFVKLLTSPANIKSIYELQLMRCLCLLFVHGQCKSIQTSILNATLRPVNRSNLIQIVHYHLILPKDTIYSNNDLLSLWLGQLRYNILLDAVSFNCLTSYPNSIYLKQTHMPQAVNFKENNNNNIKVVKVTPDQMKAIFAQRRNGVLIPSTLSMNDMGRPVIKPIFTQGKQ